MNTPFVKQLPSISSGYESVLRHPDSRKLRSGFVALEVGGEGHSHSTEEYEEMLVVLSGSGELVTEKYGNFPLTLHSIAYVPPQTIHLVRNTGTEPMQYLYIVTIVEKSTDC